MYKALVLLLLWIAAAPETALLPQSIGETFAAAINGFDDEALRRVIPDLFAADALRQPSFDRQVALFHSLRGRTGGLEVHHIDVDATRWVVHIFARQKSDKAWVDVQLGLSKTPPRKTLRLFIGEATEPVELPRGSMDNPATLKWLGEYITNLNRDYGFSGQVLIARQGKPIFEQAIGVADRQHQLPLKLDTPMNMASGGKMFTAVAIAQLAQQGKLRLEDHLIQYLPDYPDKVFAAKVTLAELLTHSSGLGDYWDEDYEKNWGNIRSLRQTLPYVVSKPQLFEHGAATHYSNSGYLVLGLVVEKVSGTDFFDYVKRDVLQPAGMMNTDYYLRDTSDPIARNYEKEDSGRWRVVPSGYGGIRQEVATRPFATCCNSTTPCWAIASSASV